MGNDQYSQLVASDQGYNSVNSPFSGMGGVLPPNIPMQADTPQMITALLSDDTLNKPLKDEFFWVIHKDNALTFLDTDRKQDKMLAFDIAKIDAMNDTQWYDYTFQMERKWNIMRNIFETKLDRALGTENSQQKNERTVEQSQFSESRQISQHEDGSTYQREGFIKRLLGRKS